MNSVVFVTIGLLLLILLWTRSRRPGAVLVNSRLGQEASQDLVQLPPGGLLSRCLSEEDIEFVTRLGSKAVLRLLLQERRRIALAWLQLTGREARRVLRLHVQTVRSAADLRPVTEFKLLAEAGAFLLIYELLTILVRWYGPFRAQAYVGCLRSLGGLLAGLGSAITQLGLPAAAARIAPARGE